MCIYRIYRYRYRYRYIFVLFEGLWILSATQCSNAIPAHTWDGLAGASSAPSPRKVSALCQPTGNGDCASEL